MDLSDLRALLHVVEHGSFQRAAMALRVSRSALRRQVERLEQELDVALLSRGAKGIELTAAGRELADGATRLLRDAANLTDRARSFRADARGSMRFIVPIGTPNGVRARALVALRALHPDLDLEVLEAEDPLTLLSEPFDLMFHFGRPPNREGWFSHVVLRVPTLLRSSSSYLEEHGTPRSLDELDAHPLIQWSAPGLDGSRDLPLHGGGSAAVTPWVRSANLGLLLELAERDAGIVYGPVLPPRLEPTRSPLVPILEDVVGTEVSLRALTPRPSHADPRIRALLENLRRMLATLEGAETPKDD